MSRGNSIKIWRPIAVWCGVTVAAVATAAAVPGAWAAARSAEGSQAVADLLVAACATGLTLALAWLWVITTVTVPGLLATDTGTTHVRTGGAARRLVLVACGVAVVAGTSVAALASGGGDGPELLVGLTLPERAVAPPQVHRHAEPVRAVTASSGTYVVRPGDSLWSIARAHPEPATSIDHRWRAIWQANRDVVGDDPDLITPGQALRLPLTPTTHSPQDPSSDGDR